MVTLNHAVELAKEYLQGLFGHVIDLRLEEVEHDDKCFFITLGYFDPKALAYSSENRTYKVFAVSIDDGAIISMKMRLVGNA